MAILTTAMRTLAVLTARYGYTHCGRAILTMAHGLSIVNSRLPCCPPTSSSQLEVTRPFVLRHIHKGLGPEVLDRTLKSNQRRGAQTAVAPPAVVIDNA